MARITTMIIMHTSNKHKDGNASNNGKEADGNTN